jgi:Cu/Ag efflux pump CusA
MTLHEIKLETSAILAVYLVLALFGIGYNAAVAWWERQRYIEGFVSLAVVLGVLITLGGVAVLSWQAALIALGGFVASGAPMVAGSIIRYVQRRAEDQRHVRQTARVAERGEGAARPGR